ncbi:MAG: hypothetical protein AMS17_13310 [Spirochaetes bacterium DG_61]|nr:MAG: hypothetical protein AMS17_13310 [Spirochaetes bacterium DG_61]
MFDREKKKTHTFGMDIEQALEFLGLSISTTTEDLNSTFRKLAKKYHPDFNQGKEKWAHGKMTQLNIAYETALKYFTSPGEVTETAKKTYDIPFSARFNQAVQVVLGAILLYYQYGLENVHLRKEGSRRFRYRESLRQIERGITRLEVLKPSALLDTQQKKLELFVNFSRAFLQNMLIEKYFVPSGIEIEHRAYRHYAEGCSMLDYAIKDAFFGDRLIRIRSGSFYQKISLSYEEFLIIIARYHKSSWIPETIIKIYLLEMFTKIIKLFKSMRY